MRHTARLTYLGHEYARPRLWSQTGVRTLIVLATYRIRITTGTIYDFWQRLQTSLALSQRLKHYVLKIFYLIIVFFK